MVRRPQEHIRQNMTELKIGTGPFIKSHNMAPGSVHQNKKKTNVSFNEREAEKMRQIKAECVQSILKGTHPSFENI